MNEPALGKGNGLIYSAVLNAAEEYISYTVVLQRSEGIKKRVCYKARGSALV